MTLKYFFWSARTSGQIFSNARILHIYPSPFQLFLWFTLDDDEEEEYDEEAADDEQDGAGLGLVAGLLVGEAGGRVVAVEAQQGLQVQPGQVVARVPGDHRHHAAAAHGGHDVSGRVAGHGAGDVSDVAGHVGGDVAIDVSDVVLLVVITAPVSNISHVIRATPDTLLLGPGGEPSARK